MCYLLVMSTTSEQDFTEFDTPSLQFSRDVFRVPEAALLKYPNRWFIASRDGCSCGFRHHHTSAVSFGFMAPENWYPEDVEDIEATLQLVEVFKGIVSGGEALDCIDAWNDGSGIVQEPQGSLLVDLQTVDACEFIFFEGYHFEFTAGQVSSD